MFTLTDHLLEDLEQKPFQVLPSIKTGWLYYIFFLTCFLVMCNIVVQIADFSLLIFIHMMVYSAWVVIRTVRRIWRIYYLSLFLQHRVLELKQFIRFIFDHEQWYIESGEETVYTFPWDDFSGFHIKGKCLYLIQQNPGFLLLFKQEAIGRKNFDCLFLEAMARLKRSDSKQAKQQNSDKFPGAYPEIIYKR